MEYHSAMTKKQNVPFETPWMNLEDIELGEISQSQKNKYYMTPLI